MTDTNTTALLASDPIPASKCRRHDWVIIHLPADEWVPFPHTMEACRHCTARS